MNTTEYYTYAALRGPDAWGEFAYILKTIFTMRLRYWVGVQDAPTRHFELGSHLPESARKQAEKSGGAPPWWAHWYDHRRSALKCIVNHPDVFGHAAEAADLLVLLEELEVILNAPATR